MLYNDSDLNVWYPIYPVSAVTCPDWIKNIKDIKVCTHLSSYRYCIIGLDSITQTITLCPTSGLTTDCFSIQCITDPADAYKYKSYALLAEPLTNTITLDPDLYQIHSSCIHIEIIGPTWECPGSSHQFGVMLEDGYNVEVSGDSSQITIYGGVGAGLGVFPVSNITYKGSTGLRSINGITDAVRINSRSSDLVCTSERSSDTVTITLSLSANAYDT